MFSWVRRGFKAFDEESLFERNHDAVARLAADYPSDVAAASGIFRQHDIARPETPHRTVADFDLNLSGKGDYILAPGRRVIIAPMGCRHTTKEDSMHRLKLGNFHVSPQVKFDVDFLEMRFIVRAGVKSNDLHLRGFKRIGGKKQGRKNREPLFQSFQMLGSD